ncbi:sensor histidine kinase [Frigoribacterium salinisoli]
MTTTTSGTAATPVVDDAAVRALGRMRGYTTWSFVAILVVYVAASALQASTPGIVAGTLVAGALAAWQAFSWEGGAPWPLTLATVLVGTAVWVVGLTTGDLLATVVPLAFSLGLATTAPPLLAWPWTLAAVGVVVGPALVVEASGAGTGPVGPVVGLAAVGASIGLFRLNRYAFGLYLAIDRLRETSAELAVVQERYRFAADLHDIQGQALHVSRLQLQLADRLLDADPQEARARLREATGLIDRAIADTRTLAHGRRSTTLAGELANSLELLRAAGIEVAVTGAPAADGPHDQLLGLVVRETTTNLLRHAQATRVTVSLGPGSVRLENDGVDEAPRRLSGLARLGDRFAAVGGVLRTEARDGSFVTEARTTP